MRSASGICGSPRRRCRSVTVSSAVAWVVVACLGYSRAGAGALIFSKEAPDVLWGMTRCLWSIGALPELMVWDREGCLHAGGGRPTETYAAFCGQLPVGWLFCEPADPQAKGCGGAAAGIHGDEFRARPSVREPSRLPVAARRVV